MPRKITREITTYDAPETEQPKIHTEEKAPDVQRDTFQSFQAKFGTNKAAQVRIHIETPHGMEFVKTLPIGQVKGEETLAEMHRTSRFASESGVYHLTMEVNGESFPLDPIRIAPQTSGPDTQQGKYDGMTFYGPMAEMFREMREDRQRQQEHMQQIILALTQRQTPMLDMLNGMAQLDQLRSKNTGIMDNMETFLKIMEFGRNLATAPEEGWDGLLRGVIKDAAPAILPALPKLMSAITAPKPQVQGAPVAPPDIPPDKPKEQPMPTTQPDAPLDEPMNPEIKQALQGAINFLKTRCLKGTHPDLYIATVLDFVEDPTYARLVSEIAKPESSSFDSFVKTIGDTTISGPPFREWFEYLYNGIRSELANANQMVTDSTGKSGDTNNSQQNGPTREGSD